MSRTSTRDRFAPASRVGDYRIERELHSEETGAVYLGVHLVLPREAEIKVMHGSHAWIREAAVSVLREACLLEALSHPGIPRVYECGMLPDRRPWSAFAHVHGDPVDDGVLAISDLVPILRDAGEILEHAHTRGVTHGRVMTANLVRVTGGRFPLCLRGWSDATTRDAAEALDPSHDIRALGAIAFRALTGEHPGGASTAEHCPNAPSELVTLIDRMLAREVGATEVRDCATWLANTVELIPTRQRWTPIHGIGPDKLPAADDSFAIRITRR